MTRQLALMPNDDQERAEEARILAARREEQAARARHKQQLKMQKAAARRRAQDWRRKLADAIRETKKQHPQCRCRFAGVGDAAALRAMGGGCTMPDYVCPRLDAIRRKV